MVISPIGRKLTLTGLLCLAILSSVRGFAPSLAISSPTTLSSTRLLVSTTSVEEDSSTELTNRGLLKRDRYIATNRFAVRDGRQGKFEQRWATRKSRLATLDGFKYFHLMRRVTLNEDGSCSYDGGDSDATAAGNYVSFTIWEKKSHFSAWRTGDAFKEAHGGTSITAFLSTMVNSALVLRGAPRPAFYDGLLVQGATPENVPQVVDGWRSVEADGINTLPTECFVACNQFFVPPENAAAFEKRWAERESKLMECPGFVAFSMLRRDGTAKGHGTSPMSNDEPSYVSTTLWKDRQAFENWRSSSSPHAHGKDKGTGGPVQPPAPLWSQPPRPVFYEGTLVITSDKGV